MQQLVQITNFPGFYESSLDAMIDREVESVFNCDDSGCESNIPDSFYYSMNWQPVREAMAREYADQYMQGLADESGIALVWEYESFTSPRFYNFETDRLWVHIASESVQAIYDNTPAHLIAQVFRERFTSYDGFLSSYDNTPPDKPLADWDHNELSALLDAFALHHGYEPEAWELLERWNGNGGLSDAIWDAMPDEMRRFAEAQREYGQAASFELWQETGNCYPEGTEREDIPELPPRPCAHTLNLLTWR